MLHFVGVTGCDPLPVAIERMSEAGRCLGGDGFGPVGRWSGTGCCLAFRHRPLRAGSASGPVLGAHGALTLIGAGRIDRQNELKAALGLDPGRADDDAALMLAAFERWGEAAADRLHGDFAFAVWDHAAQRLTLARDSFGTVPLFFHQGDGFAVFATNPAAMLALGIIPHDLNPATLGEHLIGRSADAHGTVYAAIRRVPRASTAVLAPEGLRLTEYWRPHRGPTLRLKTDQDYVEATRAMLAEVLRGHLRTVSPIAVMLSGGLDSGAIAATLAQLAPEREILGLTILPMAGARAGRSAREWEHVQQLARLHPNLRVQAVRAKPMTPLDGQWRQMFDAIGVPISGLGLLARRLPLALAAQAQGVGTLLRGDGGNRTLTAEGEDIFRALFRQGRWLAMWHECRGTARFRGLPLWEVAIYRMLRDLLPRPVLAALRHVRGRHPAPLHAGNFLDPAFAGASGLLAQWEHAPHNPARKALLHNAAIEPVNLHIQPAHADSQTLLYNRLGMECLAPLRDRRLVDFILSLPPEQFRRDGVTRFLARRVLADRMPAETLAEPGYFEPFPDAAEWAGQWWNAAARHLDGQHPPELAAAAIDLPGLAARLAEAPPSYGPDIGLSVNAVGNALHINDFIRWHAGRNQ